MTGDTWPGDSCPSGGASTSRDTWPGGVASWYGDPVAHTVREAQPRQRLAVMGQISDVRVRHDPGPILEADLDDGTGQVTLVYLGRTRIAGIATGVRISAEAPLLARHGRLELLNPRYRFELPLPPS